MMNVAPVFLISLMRSNSFPLPLIRYFTPNSSPNLSARNAFSLSPALKICNKDLFALKASKDKSLLVAFPCAYHFAS